MPSKISCQKKQMNKIWMLIPSTCQKLLVRLKFPNDQQTKAKSLWSFEPKFCTKTVFWFAKQRQPIFHIVIFVQSTITSNIL